jgi:hypothetical protein
MLADHPIDPMILATDLAGEREFYGARIGLELLIETDDFLTFRCGGNSIGLLQFKDPEAG